MAAVLLRAFLCFSLQVWQNALGLHPLSQGSLFPVCFWVLLTAFLCGSKHTLYTSSIADVCFFHAIKIRRKEKKRKEKPARSDIRSSRQIRASKTTIYFILCKLWMHIHDLSISKSLIYILDIFLSSELYTSSVFCV